MCDKCNAEQRALFTAVAIALAASPHPVVQAYGGLLSISQKYAGEEEISEAMSAEISEVFAPLSLKQTGYLHTLAEGMLTATADACVQASVSILTHGIASGAAFAVDFARSRDYRLPTFPDQPRLDQLANQLDAMATQAEIIQKVTGGGVTVAFLSVEPGEPTGDESDTGQLKPEEVHRALDDLLHGKRQRRGPVS